MQHRFGLIGASVAGGDAIQDARFEQFSVEFDSDAARGLLQVAGQGKNIGVTEMEWESKLFGQFSNELGIRARGFAANTVLDMDHAQLEIPARRKFPERVKQKDGIGPAGYSYANAAATAQHLVAGDEMRDSLD